MAAKLNDFLCDFKFLLELKSYLKEYIETKVSVTDVAVLRKGELSNLSDGRCVRLVLPHGYCVLQDVSLDNGLYFVGFIGSQNQHISENITDKVWKLDIKLIDAFADHSDILAYISAERQKGGDWGNLVLLKSIDAIEKWKNCEVHRTAIK